MGALPGVLTAVGGSHTQATLEVGDGIGQVRDGIDNVVERHGTSMPLSTNIDVRRSVNYG